MSRYLASQDVRAAVERLDGSSNFGRIFDYLVGMRTLALTPGGKSGLGMSDEGYVQAAEELGRWTDDPDVTSPFFSPFGPSEKHYKSAKWISNGVATNVWKWAGNPGSPFTIHHGSPKQISRADPDPKKLFEFLIGRKPKPGLLDAAIWYLRATEFPDDQLPTDADLIDRFVADMGIDAAEVDLLFDRAEAQ